jgi:hypothetical protein
MVMEMLLPDLCNSIMSLSKMGNGVGSRATEEAPRWMGVEDLELLPLPMRVR